MRIPIYQVDAFTRRIFGGNPAAVCPLKAWPSDGLLQSVALENNLSETAFLVPEGEGFRLRWFTPRMEVDLCGHATLAAAHVVFERLRTGGSGGASTLRFHSLSGPLGVERRGRELILDLPSRPPEACDAPPELLAGLGRQPESTFLAGPDYLLAVFPSETEVRDLTPDFAKLEELGSVGRIGVCVTAPGDEVDFVSRFFAPAAGVPEDPVTGSAHCSLTPYWGRRLGKKRLEARQVSQRGGEIRCEWKRERVALGGACVLYMEGEIEVEDPDS